MQNVCTGEDVDTEFNRIECRWVGCWYFESIMYFSLINIATAISKEDISLSGSWFYCLSDRVAAQCMFSAPGDWLTSMQRNYQAEMIKTSLNGTELWGMTMFNYNMCFFFSLINLQRILWSHNVYCLTTTSLETWGSGLSSYRPISITVGIIF